MKLKTLSFALFCCITSISQAQKPRYFRLETPGCPVDPLKEILKGGLFRENVETIRITETEQLNITVKADRDAAGNPTTVSAPTVGRYSDTLLLVALPLKRGVAFDIVKTVGSYTVIRLWPRNLNETIISDLKALANTIKNNPSNLSVEGVVGTLKNAAGSATEVELSGFDYVVPTSLLLNNSVEFENKMYQWNIGVLAMPVKIRPFATESGQFEFLDGISFGTTFAWTLAQNRMTGRTASVFLYAGLSSFTTDQFKIKEERKDYKLTTFSPGVGLLVEKSKIQLSFMTGFDFPAGEVQKKWVYRNMPWASIGLGFSLFKIASDESPRTGTN